MNESKEVRSYEHVFVTQYRRNGDSELDLHYMTESARRSVEHQAREARKRYKDSIKKRKV